MSFQEFSAFIDDLLHLTSQAFRVPTIILLLAAILYALWCIGSIIVEIISEHRHMKAKIPEIIDAIDMCDLGECDEVIALSGLLKRQKASLTELLYHLFLPEDSLVALAKRLLADEQLHYDKIVGRTDTMTKIAPMLGLMGTLIPLGPGIVALGQGDTNTLAASMLVAFDTTVAGLVVAIVTFVVSKLRKRWYEDYMISLETVMTSLLDKIIDTKASGKELPVFERFLPEPGELDEEGDEDFTGDAAGEYEDAEVLSGVELDSDADTDAEAFGSVQDLLSSSDGEASCDWLSDEDVEQTQKLSALKDDGSEEGTEAIIDDRADGNVETDDTGDFDESGGSDGFDESDVSAESDDSVEPDENELDEKGPKKVKDHDQHAENAKKPKSDEAYFQTIADIDAMQGDSDDDADDGAVL